MTSNDVTITEYEGGLRIANTFETPWIDLLPEQAAALREYFVPEDVQKLVAQAHGWCPACHGTGMVMEFAPTDCPNLEIHRALEAAYSQNGVDRG